MDPDQRHMVSSPYRYRQPYSPGFSRSSISRKKEDRSPSPVVRDVSFHSDGMKADQVWVVSYVSPVCVCVQERGGGRGAEVG
jgi:hypothetical protein